jgi:2-alkyl-3-oxoalkanoate reductase
VAEAVVLSLTNGRNGGLYFITDQEESTVRDFFATLFTKLGLNIPKVSLPKFLVWPVATVVESVWRLFQLHSNPPISRFDLSFVAMSRRYLTAHATYELKYKPIVSRSLGFENVVLDSERS